MFRPNVVYDHCNSNGQMALSVDDGPWLETTTTLLDMLDQNNVKMTYFVICSNIANDSTKDLLREIKKRGHDIGVHGWVHTAITTMSNDQIVQDMGKCDVMMKEVLGYTPRLYRAPYGYYNDQAKQTLSSLGFNLVQWSYDSLDWSLLNVDLIVARAKAGPLAVPADSNNWIALFHDIHKTTLSSLQQLLPLFTGAGYKFVTMSECLQL